MERITKVGFEFNILLGDPEDLYKTVNGFRKTSRGELLDWPRGYSGPTIMVMFKSAEAGFIGVDRLPPAWPDSSRLVEVWLMTTGDGEAGSGLVSPYQLSVETGGFAIPGGTSGKISTIDIGFKLARKELHRKHKHFLPYFDSYMERTHGK
jgi:hypothetical protein